MEWDHFESLSIGMWKRKKSLVASLSVKVNKNNLISFLLVWSAKREGTFVFKIYKKLFQCSPLAKSFTIFFREILEQKLLHMCHSKTLGVKCQP